MISTTIDIELFQKSFALIPLNVPILYNLYSVNAPIAVTDIHQFFYFSQYKCTRDLALL